MRFLMSTLLLCSTVVAAGHAQTAAEPTRSGAQVTADGAWCWFADPALLALLALPDGRVMAFYSRHTGSEMLMRETTTTASYEHWSEERSLELNTPPSGSRTRRDRAARIA
jgi:hypothetical protein